MIDLAEKVKKEVHEKKDLKDLDKSKIKKSTGI